MQEYIANHNVIINPLHFRLLTIGCNRCTTPVLPDEPWGRPLWHLGRGPCIAHQPTDLDRAKASVEFPDDLIDRILGRVDYAI
jgi:phosphoadenosine phosphosulfate reductase